MFAVLRTGGKQYRVEKSSVIDVELLEGEVGSTLTLDDILCVGAQQQVTFGTPQVPGASVKVKVLDHLRGEKVLNFKKRRRKKSQRLRGHRQSHTRLEVLEIVSGKAK